MHNWKPVCRHDVTEHHATQNSQGSNPNIPTSGDGYWALTQADLLSELALAHGISGSTVCAVKLLSQASSPKIFICAHDFRWSPPAVRSFICTTGVYDSHDTNGDPPGIWRKAEFFTPRLGDWLTHRVVRKQNVPKPIDHTSFHDGLRTPPALGKRGITLLYTGSVDVCCRQQCGNWGCNK